MAPLSKLTLTSYQQTHPNRNPIEERRIKTLAVLEQQKIVLTLSVITQMYEQRQKRKLCGQGVMLLLKSTSVKIPHSLSSNIANPIRMFTTVIPLMHTAKLCINGVSLIREGRAAKNLILMEAGTGIEPVYTDLQSAA